LDLDPDNRFMEIAGLGPVPIGSFLADLRIGRCREGYNHTAQEGAKEIHGSPTLLWLEEAPGLDAN
jgi:hypothetical protein